MPVCNRPVNELRCIELGGCSQADMPEISRFLGIVIHMYYRDHPPSHFHAEYAEHEISVDIASGAVTGEFPGRALNAILEWYGLHKDELAEDWQRARQGLPLIPI